MPSSFNMPRRTLRLLHNGTTPITTSAQLRRRPIAFRVFCKKLLRMQLVWDGNMTATLFGRINCHPTLIANSMRSTTGKREPVEHCSTNFRYSRSQESKPSQAVDGEVTF